MTTRMHHMPFGAQIQPDGRVRFRLWAPTAKEVAVVLADRGEPMTMAALPEGWFELNTTAATAGSLYQFRIGDRLAVPDPASRSNPRDVHGPSEVVDPRGFQWHDTAWEGLPWHQAVFYEVHIGSFSPEGTFAGAQQRLDHLAKLGITAIELMPVADFPGKFNWGYDGVLPFAPDHTYGTPDDFKRLIAAAHQRGLMVFLDVVYNHFGPEGNYLHTYAETFFTSRHQTPWGAALNFDDRSSKTVREFFIHNALYWLEEYHLDGLRFDAVHAVQDDSACDIFSEISQRVRERLGREREIHLVLENGDNEARRLSKAPAPARRFEAQWNDDIHHCLHTILTGEADGYYRDFARDPYRLLGRCLAEGFAFQGEPFRHHHNKPRGEPSAGLPPTAFIAFLQNHDQIGNRACGERLIELTTPAALKTAMSIILLVPQIPMLFMGEEWAAREPFPFFSDFGPQLAAAVREGRQREFAHFDKFKLHPSHSKIPDPCAMATAVSAKLDWSRLAEPQHAEWLTYCRELLDIRQREIVPLLSGARSGSFELHGTNMLTVRWPLGKGALLTMTANLTAHSQPQPSAPAGRVIFANQESGSEEPMLAWSVLWWLRH